MTLALALRGCNGLVLGTDSRVTSVVPQAIGPPQTITSDTSEKFLQVNRDIGVLTYGLAEPGYSGISRLVEQAKRNRYPRYQDIETAAQAVFLTEFNTWTQAQQQPAVAAAGVVGFILSGYDSVLKNQFRVTSFQSANGFQPQEIVQPTFLAAQFHIAQYLTTKLYRQEMTVAQLTQLAVFLMLETMSTEITVGGPIQLATVTVRNGFQRVTEEEIDKLLDTCQSKVRDFRRLLLEL
jgi:20S proteasome alpha/beta subunit